MGSGKSSDSDSEIFLQIPASKVQLDIIAPKQLTNFGEELTKELFKYQLQLSRQGFNFTNIEQEFNYRSSIVQLMWGGGLGGNNIYVVG